MSREFLIYGLIVLTVAFMAIMAWAGKRLYDCESRKTGSRFLVLAFGTVAILALWPIGKVPARPEIRLGGFGNLAASERPAAATIPLEVHSLPAGGATIHVVGMQPEAITDAVLLDSALIGGTQFRWTVPPRDNTAGGSLEFVVARAGLVYLSCDSKDIMRGELAQQGWEYVGRRLMSDDRAIELFRRQCRDGESLTINYHQGWAPEIFVPPAAPSPLAVRISSLPVSTLPASPGYR